MANLYSQCNKLSPDFFPELLLSSISSSQETDKDSDCNNTANDWLDNITFLGKLTLGAGGFALFVFYLSIPKPHLASRFATLSISSSPVPAQLKPEITKQKKESRLDDMRQGSTIGTALETEASGSGVQTSDVLEGLQPQEDVRRTTSSAVSIEPRGSEVALLQSERTEKEFALREELPSQQGKRLEVVEEQQVVTNAPEIQEMGLEGVVNRFRPNPASSAGGGGRGSHQRPGRGSRSGHVSMSTFQAGTSSEGGGFDRPQGVNPAESQPKRRRCSPCSESFLNCCQVFLNPFTRNQAASMSMSGPSSSNARAQRRGPFPHATTGNFAPESEGEDHSTTGNLALETSTLEWEDHSMAELYQMYLDNLTEEKRDAFDWDCFFKLSPSKQAELKKFVTHENDEADKVATERSVQIGRYTALHNCHFEIEQGSSSEVNRLDYWERHYKETVPWQQRLVLDDLTKFKPTNSEDFDKIKSHTGDITPESVASLKKELTTCSQRSLTALEAGRKRALEVAFKNGHLRVLPVTFDGHNDDQNLKNMITLLKHRDDCKFSAYKEVAELVKEAHKALNKEWPSVEDTPLSTSLPRNLFSIGKDNVFKSADSHKTIKWTGKNLRGKSWPLKVIEPSIEWKGPKPYGMLLVSQDLLHVDKHYETYDEDGVYLGKMDKDTMLLYAESIPYQGRFAVPKNKSKS